MELFVSETKTKNNFDMLIKRNIHSTKKTKNLNFKECLVLKKFNWKNTFLKKIKFQ